MILWTGGTGKSYSFRLLVTPIFLAEEAGMDINITTGISSTGYGVVGLNVLNAFHSLGHAPALWPIGQIEASEHHHEVIQLAIARTECYSPFAPSLRIWHQFNLAQHVGKDLHCAMPIFELDRFRPVEGHHLKQQDLLFVPSQWAKQVLINGGVPEHRIAVAPLGVDQNIFYPRPQPRPSPESITTSFLNVGKWELRKGHDVLVAAFNKAFTKADNVRLCMLSFNPCFQDLATLKRYNDQWASLYRRSALGDKITVISDRLKSHEEVANLMGSVDCGVFPTRAEGWNLELGEMLAMGKTCITTNNTAQTEFITADNCRLIETPEMELAFDGVWFNGQGMWCAFGTDQMDQLVEHLRQVHKLKQAGELKPNLVGAADMQKFTWENTVGKIVEQF